jgi:TonB family protein
MEVPEKDLENLEIEIKNENLIIPEEGYENVKNITTDLNETRTKSDKNWSENKFSGSSEESIRDYERKLFEEYGGKKDKTTPTTKQETVPNKKQTTSQGNKDPNNQSGSNTAYAGAANASFDLKNRSPFQNDGYWIRKPSYMCNGRGKVAVKIMVDQGGTVTSATVSSSSNATACMLEQAVKYAKLSRFNYSKTAPKLQEGTIIYSFDPQ